LWEVGGERMKRDHGARVSVMSRPDPGFPVLRSVGYRPVYEVRDNELIVVVVAIGKRERNAVYKAAARR